MKKTFYSILLSGLMLFALAPQTWGQGLPESITVWATGTVSVAAGKGKVNVLAEPGTPATYYASEHSLDISATVSGAVNVIGAATAGGVEIPAYFYARPDTGYYFAYWTNAETKETFTSNPLEQSVLSNRGNGPCLYYALLEDTCYSGWQVIGPLQATFLPIPLHSCTGGRVETVYLSETSKTWYVTVSTSYATSISDFNSPTIDVTDTAGCTFSLGNATFSDNVITIPITFTRELSGAEGNYTTNLTVSSLGGVTFTVPVKAIVEEDVPDGVVATVINGNAKTNYTSIDEALGAVPANATLQLRRDIALTATQNITKTFTLDLNGKVLSSNTATLLNIAGGNLTIIDSKMIGQITLSAPAEAADDMPAVRVTSGALTMNRGTIAATAASATKGAMAVQVVSGNFTLNDGLLQATATNNAAAIMNAGGTVIMKSGELQATAATNVATLAAYAGTTTVENGSITATLTGSNTAAGVYVLSGATVTVQRATVLAEATDNSFAGGLFAAYAQGNLTISKKAELKAISNNTKDAYALYIDTGSSVTVDGALLSASDSQGIVFEVAFPDMSALADADLQAAFFVTDKTTLDAALASSGLPLTVYQVAAGVEYNNGYRAFIGASYEKAKANGVSMFRIDDKAYTSLEDALLYAQNNPSEDNLVIIQVNDYTMPAGYYTLPANATLLVPYDASQLKPCYSKVKRVDNSISPSPYRTLTIAAGVHLDVYGIIEAGGQQRPANATDPGPGAYVTGTYGWIKLDEGSEITLENNATLYAWGYVTGAGEIEARRGAVVREFFQIQDWPGAGNAIRIWQNSPTDKCFPLNQYFIQNVEAATSYHPGSRLYCSFAATGAGITLAADGIQLVGVTGENAIFLMDNEADADNTWVRKWYDVTNDKQVYDINSGAHLGSLYIPLPALRTLSAMLIGQTIEGFDSKDFVLPITSNMKIHLLTGSMDITQNTELLPGAEIEVDKNATVTIADAPDVDYDGDLYLVDSDNWGLYSRSAYGQTINYTPSLGGAPTARDVSSPAAIGDAKLNVHGTFVVNGRLLTTEGGANIFSNNADAGTISFATSAPATVETTKLYHYKGGESSSINLIPAHLQNTEGQTPAFATTATTPSGQSFCFINDRWTIMYNFKDLYLATHTEMDEDDFVDSLYVVNNYSEWYIKPAAYVAVATQATDEYSDLTPKITTRPLENADHTYSDAAGEGRLFIFLNDQWWEVTLENNLYRGTDGKYYVYDEGEGSWKEKKFKVRFVNWNGSDIANEGNTKTVYELSYGIIPKYNGINPTREENVDYTYSFTGWEPAFVPVTEDATYTATYSETKRKYTIVFLNENGTEIERHFLTRDEVPVCDNPPTKTGYYLTWSPAIGAVTGSKTYQATFLPEPPTEFTITFKNYDGTMLKQADKTTDAVYTIEAGESLYNVFDGEAIKPATAEYTYNFTGWSPAITSESVATEDMTFIAQYEQARQTATVIFYQEDGTTQIGEAQTVKYGQTPVVPAYQKANTAEYTYTMGWTPAVTAVSTSGTITYRATVTAVKNRYTVSGTATGCNIVGLGTYEYGTEVTLSLVVADGFVNAQWSDGTTGNKVITVTEDVTLSASASVMEDEIYHIGVGDTEELTSDTTKTSFIIEANATGAGQLIGAEHLRLPVNGNAYYKYTFNATAKTWYSFSVPFECDGATATSESGRTMVIDVDYDLLQYNGATRAANGTDKSAWEYIADLGNRTLTPGKLYMIRFATAQTSATFAKKKTASIVYASPVSINTYDGDTYDRNWNSIAGPRLYTVSLEAGVSECQIYNPGDDNYTTYTISEQTFPIGKAAFIQASSSRTLGVSSPILTPAPVRRAAAQQNTMAVVEMMKGNKMSDRIILRTSDEAMDEYEVGKDLLKFGVSKKVGQMWVNRYDARLSVNNIAMDDEVAVYPLGISAPQAGEYTLTLAQTTGDVTVYLTLNGEVVANLSGGNYTLDLTKGTTEQYAIRMVSKPRGVVTDFDEVTTDQGVQKVIMDGMLYIIRDGKVYNAQGAIVK